MKKFFAVAILAIAVTGLAVASSLSVPFFLDNGNTGTLRPTQGTTSFIGLKNNTAAAVTVTVSYRDVDGADQTPAANTFVIGPYGTRAYRPVTTDATAEGTLGASTPKMVAGIAGSSLYQWAGTPFDIQGRIVQNFDNASAAAYLLPQGFSN